jgi:hypothetical protein
MHSMPAREALPAVEVILHGVKVLGAREVHERALQLCGAVVNERARLAQRRVRMVGAAAVPGEP